MIVASNQKKVGKLDIYLFFYSMNLNIIKINLSLYTNIQRLSAQMSLFYISVNIGIFAMVPQLIYL